MDLLMNIFCYNDSIRVFYYLIIFTVNFSFLSVLRFQSFNYFRYFKWNIHLEII